MDKLKELKELKESFNLASKKEVALLISEIIRAVKDLKETLAGEVKTHKENMSSEMSMETENCMKKCLDMCKEVQDELKMSEKRLASLVSKSTKETLDEAYKSLNREIYGVEQLIKSIPQYDSTQLEKRFSAVIFDLESSLQKAINEVKLTGEQIVDLVNDLNIEPDLQIDKEHIKGLKEWQESIETRISNIPSGRGGGSGNSVQYYDISSELDGGTSSFTIPKHRRVVAVMGTSFPTIFRPTIDYTISGRTLTFTSQIDPATTLASGQTVTVLYVGLFNII